MPSYLEMCNELMNAIKSDALPDEVKKDAVDKLNKLFNILWPYSD